MNKSQIWTALYTLSRKEIRRFTRIWIQTLLPPGISMTLYFIIFGNLIGERIGDMDSFSYMEYIVPGLIMMSVITNSYSNVASSLYSTKFQRNFEEILVSPMPNWIVLVGFVVGGMTRGLMVGILVTLLSLFFTQLSINNLFVTISIVLLTSLLFALCGFINGLLANSFDDIAIIPTFVLTPMIYLGGVFYSITLLSEFWQTVSLINPILYMVNAFRYGVLGVTDINLVAAYGMILFMISLLFILAMYLLRSGYGVKH